MSKLDDLLNGLDADTAEQIRKEISENTEEAKQKASEKSIRLLAGGVMHRLNNDMQSILTSNERRNEYRPFLPIVLIGSEYIP